MKNIIKIILCILVSYVIIFTGWSIKEAVIHYSNTDGLPILGYHGVEEDNIKNTKYKNNPYILSKSMFIRHMKYLHEHHYTSYSLDEVNDYYLGKLDIKDKSIVLTFDDGYKNFKTIVEPILKKYNFKGTCFVIGSKVNTESKYLSSNDINNDKIVEFYSHSYNLHKFDTINRRLKKIETCSYQTIKKDFNKNKSIVSDKYFAYPYGVSSKNAIKYLKQSNVKLAFGYNENRNMTRSSNRYLIPRYLIIDKMPDFYIKWIVE